MIPKYLTETSKSRRKKSQKQERHLSKVINKETSSRVQAGSGSLWGNKGDVRAEHWLIENKRTDKESIVLHQGWLEKIKKEALKDGRKPALEIEIGGRRYLIIDEAYL